MDWNQSIKTRKFKKTWQFFSFSLSTPALDFSAATNMQCNNKFKYTTI